MAPRSARWGWSFLTLLFVSAGLDVRNPFSVSVFEDHIYWSTQEKGEVFRQDKFGRGTKVKLLTAGPWLTQISVYQQQRYNSMRMNSPCKGICSHLCLLRPGGYTCACPEGTSFISGSKTECDAGFDPPPTMPPPCQCTNGGTCYFDDNKALCICPSEWGGDFCEINRFGVVASSVGIAIGVTVAIALLLGGLVYTAQRKAGVMETMRRIMPSLPSMPSFRGSPSQSSGPSKEEGSELGLTLEVENIENPLYANPNEVQVGADPQHDASTTPANTVSVKEGFFENPECSSDSAEVVTPKEPVSDKSLKFELISDSVDNGFINPVFTDLSLPSTPKDSSI